MNSWRRAITANSILLTPNHLEDVIESDEDFHRFFVTVACIKSAAHINAEKVKNLVGNNAVVNTAVAALTATSAEDIVNKFVSDAAGVATGAADAANAAVEGAKDAANKAVEDAKAATVDKANEAVDNAKKEAGKQIDDAAAAAKKKLGL